MNKWFSKFASLTSGLEPEFCSDEFSSIPPSDCRSADTLLPDITLHTDFTLFPNGALIPEAEPSKFSDVLSTSIRLLFLDVVAVVAVVVAGVG